MSNNPTQTFEEVLDAFTARLLEMKPGIRLAPYHSNIMAAHEASQQAAIREALEGLKAKLVPTSPLHKVMADRIDAAIAALEPQGGDDE